MHLKEKCKQGLKKFYKICSGSKGNTFSIFHYDALSGVTENAQAAKRTLKLYM